MSGPDFEAARRALAGVRTETDSTSTSSRKLAAEYAAMQTAARNNANAQGALYADLGKVNSLAQQFGGGNAVRSAEEYAAAVTKIGGVAKLTTAEQAQVNRAVTDAVEKYRVLGQQAPPHLVKLQSETAKVQGATVQTTTSMGTMWNTVKSGAGLIGVTFGASAVVAFAKSVFDASGEIVDLSAKLKISTDAVQRYGFVARQTGGELGQWGDAIFKVGVNVAQGSEKVKNGARDLGIPFAELQRLKPEDQFDRIMRALASIESPQERNRIGVEMMGKGYANIAASVDDYIDLMGKAPVASEAAIKASDEAADAIGRAWDQAKATAINAIGGILAAWDRADRGAETARKQASQSYGQPSLSPYGNTGARGAVILDPNWKSPAQMAAEKAAAEATAKNIQTVSAAIKSNAQRLSEARAELSKLTAADRAEIDAALKLGGTIDDVGDKFALTDDAKRLYNEATREGTKAHKDFTAETKKTAEELKREAEQMMAQHRKLFGLDTIAEAQALVNLIGDFPDAWRMTEVAQRSSLETLLEAIAAYHRMGIEVPAHLKGIADQLLFISKINAGPGTVQDWMKSLPSGPQVLRDNFRPSTPVIDFRASTSAAALIRSRTTSGTSGIQDWLNRSGIPNVALTPAPSKTPIQAIFGMTSTQFGAQLGQTITGAVMGGGNVGAAAGSMIGQSIGTNIAKNSGKALEGLFGKTVGSTISAAIPGIGALLGPLAGKLVGKVADLFTGGEGGKANNLRDELKAKFGDAAGAGLQAAVDKYKGLASVQQAYSNFMSGGSRDWVQKNFDELTKAMQEADAAMAKYGLSLDDAKSPQDRFASSARSLQKEMEILKGLGFNSQQMAKGMAKELNDLVRAALDSGQKIPGAFKPLLKELLEGGLLADDLKNRLLGIPDKMLAPWKEMEAIAQEFGIDLKDMGEKFHQSKLIEGGEELAGKWRLLIDNGADMVAVNEKMAEKANDYLRAALRWGLEVPASMKPMLEKMLEAGQLTDDNGEKLEDLGGVKWGQTAAEQFDPLVQALNDLVEVFREGLPNSIDELRRRAGQPITIPVVVEPHTGRQDGRDGDADGDGVPDQYDGYPDDPNQYASGGIAAGRQVAVIAEQGRKEIVGDGEFMAGALVKAMSRIAPSQSAREFSAAVGGNGGQPTMLYARIELKGTVLDEVVIPVVATAMAQGRIPVPNNARTTRSGRG